MQPIHSWTGKSARASILKLWPANIFLKHKELQLLTTYKAYTYSVDLSEYSVFPYTLEVLADWVLETQAT